MGHLPLLHLALVVAVYLALDVANPLMPGALGLGVHHSVDSRQADRLRVEDVTGLPALAPTGEQVEVLAPGLAGVRAAPAPPRVPLRHAPRRTLPLFSAHAAPVPSDDH